MTARLPDPIVMVARRVGDVRIHTFVAAFTGGNIANATHIIEGPHRLVLVDGQFLAPYARQFRHYADSLGKPIDRLYLSHRHPDHWFGLGTAFGDVAIHALPETIDFIREHGEESRDDHRPKLGDLGPEKIIVPQEVAEPGEHTIDGIGYVLGRVTETEIDFALTIGLPEFGVFFAQDLVYSGTHLYLTGHLLQWAAVLEKLLVSDYDLIMPGHGFPAGRTEVARNVEYLAAAGQAIADGLPADAFRDFLLRRYPERKCPGIFDIYLPRLFGGATDY